MKILAFESSCDETAAAVVENGRTALSSVIASSLEEQRLYGGVVPEIASRRHAEFISAVTEQALADANVTMADIDAVAVTAAPGLIGALLVGVNYAKSLAFAAGKPLVPVHHLRGHVAANYLAHPDLKPPFLCLIASGGHSHIVAVDDYTSFRVIGRTRDDAAGECFDKAARAMGMPYPGGVALDKIAETGDPTAFSFPRPHVDGSEYDFSFSGLKTAVINLLHHAEQTGQTLNHADVCASFRDRVVEMLCTNTMKAADDNGFDTIVLAGGVSANAELRRRMTALCETSGRQLYMPPLSLCGDNAAMIGSQGFYEYRAGHTADTSLNAAPTMPIDKVEW
ncbi:MAG: tRNA (adenosine(37)-N6)-threonylcarbamoyltransferase complex transferase subunit TsaD [Clostridia bacterium]|nr:tRNA (adenosine(37)-N6)-threonylcarbamoyltransferase complex transferase subunit TsaD [Clostridia bacterium]